MWSQKLLKLFEKFKFSRFRTSFHRSGNIYCTIRSAIFDRCARYIFASIFMNTPTIANRTIALNWLIAAIQTTLRHIPRLCTILSKKKLKKISKFVFFSLINIQMGYTFCSSRAAARSAMQSDSVSASRNTGSVSTIVFDRSTVFENDECSSFRIVRFEKENVWSILLTINWWIRCHRSEKWKRFPCIDIVVCIFIVIIIIFIAIIVILIWCSITVIICFKSVEILDFQWSHAQLSVIPSAILEIIYKNTYE